MKPLVPSSVDLNDFAFMPFEFQRLFASETWILSNDAEKVAALTLWGRSWHEVPAGSLPADDRMLAHLSGAGPRWKKVKPMALRGWKLADDGRYYHPFVCEKALEAWAEKLMQRVKSSAGNAKRWGAQFDAEPVVAQLIEARELLAALNPNSRQLAKSIPVASQADSTKDSHGDPSGNPAAIPQGVPQGSQGTGTGTGKEEKPPIPPCGGQAGDAKPAKRSRKADAMTYDAFVAQCRADGEKLIPADHAVFEFAASTGIPTDFLELAWREFARQYRHTRTTQAGKRGWRQKFENSVRRNWFKLWWMPEEGACQLTTAGMQLKRERDAEAARRAAENTTLESTGSEEAA